MQFSKGFHVVELFFLYHSLVGLIIDREKFLNVNHLQQGEHTNVVMSLMVDEMIDYYSKNEHSLNCLIFITGEFIIPVTRDFGKSRHQLVLDRLQDEKKKRKRDGKQKRKVVEDGEGGDRKSPPEDAGHGDTTKSPPEVTSDGDDEGGEGGDNTC